MKIYTTPMFEVDIVEDVIATSTMLDKMTLLDDADQAESKIYTAWSSLQ